jgi:arylsulfatase A-like enzyme
LFLLSTTQELDKEFGRVLDCLSKLPNGIDERTVVVFGSDHGEMLESHEMTGKGQW